MSVEHSSAAPASAPTKVRRRDVVVGGLAALAGLGGGAAVGRATAPPAGPLLPADSVPSFAQCGEDLLMQFFFTALRVDRPTYLDVGTWEPVKLNNTYAFYLRGGRGVLVEPNPALADRIRQARPGDTLLTAGIGLSDATEADYFMFNESQLNTFDPDQVKLLGSQSHLKLEKTVRLPLVNINRVIAEHLGGKAPDVLSIDIEGLDTAVLKTLDFARYRPKMICAETLITATLRHNPDTTPFMTSLGYEVRGMTYPNTIYMDKQWLDAAQTGA